MLANLLDVIDGSGRVGGGLILGGVTNQTLLIGEGDIRRSNSVTLIVDENFDLALLHHTDAAVSRTQILIGAQQSANGVEKSKEKWTRSSWTDRRIERPSQPATRFRRGWKYSQYQ